MAATITLAGQEITVTDRVWSSKTAPELAEALNHWTACQYIGYSPAPDNLIAAITAREFGGTVTHTDPAPETEAGTVY